MVLGVFFCLFGVGLWATCLTLFLEEAGGTFSFGETDISSISLEESGTCGS